MLILGLSCFALRQRPGTCCSVGDILWLGFTGSSTAISSMADPWSITPTPGMLANLRTSLQQTTLNDVADTALNGFPKLQKLILDHIDRLPIERYVRPAVKVQIEQYLNIWRSGREEFDTRSEPYITFQDCKWVSKLDSPVEAWGQIWAYRPNGRLLWTLKVIWGLYMKMVLSGRDLLTIV